jgi:predicted cupin superfamily sugar epimerase
MDVQEIIRLLKLKKHPLEGGYYCETYRSDLTLEGHAKPSDGGDRQTLATAIYYLLTPDDFSEIHRLKSDELFHFYRGDPVEMLLLHPGGKGEIIRLGAELEKGFFPQVVVPGGVWQGSRLMPAGRFALMGTTLSPGFRFSEYESGIRLDLVEKYPDYRQLIFELTRR